MSKETWIGNKGFWYWYYKFRDSEFYSLTLAGITIIVCIVLLIYWVVPELNNWFSIRNEVITTEERISILQKNISLINSLDKSTLDQQLQVATGALPSGKDFGAMLDAISNASINSGVSLSNYSFQVGNLSSSQASSNQVGGAANAIPSGMFSTAVTVIVNGDIDQIRKF